MVNLNSQTALICAVGLFPHRGQKFTTVPPHSESLRQSDMGSVQNLIGMPSNGYVPKVAV